MEQVYKYVAEGITSGQISKQAAIELVKLIKRHEKKPLGDMAIIGMAVNVPKAGNAREYWNNILNSVDCIGSFPEARKKDIERYIYGVRNSDIDAKYSVGAFLDNVDMFDYKFFKMTPRQAGLMDPNHRLMLEIMWNVIEDAGYGGERLKGSQTGVYIGFANPPIECYAGAVYEVEPDAVQVAMTGNIAAIIPGRISYTLDLKGPSVLLDTACSSSLLAVHLACKGIENGDCDMAIAGGVKLHLFPFDHEDRKMGIESSDGRTKTFDDSSDGTGIGEGCAAVMIKPLSKALQDGDNIYAVIKSSAANQDGTSVGITAPNSDAQAEVIVKALENAGINPETISYIEAHGTGTKIGDPLEIEGISKAFRRYTDKKQFCAIGSVKTNIGHLFEGAGVTSLIKMALALKEKKLPPTLHFNKPSTKISFEDSPVYVNDQLIEWETDGTPRRCGVSAFGLSGTNCHVILEEAPSILRQNYDGDKNNPWILTLSAKSETGLNKLIDDYIGFLESEGGMSARDICYTASTGRGHYEYRLAVIGRDTSGLKLKLKKAGGSKYKEITEKGIYYGQHKISSENMESDGLYCISEDKKIQLSTKAFEKMGLLSEDSVGKWEAIEQLCMLYIQGAEIPWDEMYKGKNARKVSIPTYPFERSRCWLNLPEIEEAADCSPYYHLSWLEEGIRYKNPDVLKGAVMVFKDTAGIGDEIIAKQRAAGRQVIEVSSGLNYEKIAEQSYVVGYSQQDYEKLVSETLKAGITQILYLSALTGGKEPEGEDEQELYQQRGVFSLFYMTKAIAACGRSDKLDILLVSEYANEITGEEEVIIPENAPLFGLGKVAGREYEYMECRGLDVDAHIKAEDIIAELEGKSETYQSAYRKGKRYVEKFQELDIEKQEEDQNKIREGGIYIITGGTGGIGLESAKYLASKAKVKLALVNRSKMPEKEMWQEILKKNEDGRMCKKIQALVDIEAMGSEVFCYSANVADFNEMKAVVDGLRDKHGCINGVIHGAGLPGDTVIVLKEEDSFKKVYLPKVKGTRILDMLTEQDNLDFFIMFSSVAAIFCSPGQGDYVAANNFMDSYAAYRSRKGKKTLTIDWVAWKETGMAVETGANVDELFKAITSAKAIESMDKILNRDIKRVLIGELNFKYKYLPLVENSNYIKLSEEIIESIHKYSKNSPSLKTKQNKKKSVGIVGLTGRKDGIYTETEKKVAQIWGEVFGYSEIGVMDNFYNLGGDSILALKIISQINATTGITMTIADILNCQTIFESAEFLDKKCRAEGAPDVFESEGQAIGEEAAAALEKEAQEHQESSPRKVESTIQKDVEFDF